MQVKTLKHRLAELGFPLLETEGAQDANLTLAEVAESRDLRLWEGFPVVLANSAERGLFDYHKLKPRLSRTADRERFVSLLAMALALYKALNLKFAWANKLYQLLPAQGKRQFAKFAAKLKGNGSFEVRHQVMSGERLKSVFNNYYGQSNQTGLSGLLSAGEELGLEYALSQVFSPKQKELFLKRLKREKLTKTENEYFSRAVRKKVRALANPQLHRLAQRLLE